MIRRAANSISKRALMGVAGAVFALLLMDGALVSASRGEGAPASLLQTVQATARVAIDGSLQFVYDMRAVYQLTHLDEIAPAADSSKPRSEGRASLYLCSETSPRPAPVKTVI